MKFLTRILRGMIRYLEAHGQTRARAHLKIYGRRHGL